MAEKSHNTIFGDQGTAPDRTEEKDKLPRRSRGEREDLRVNDEDTEPGGARSDRPDRPSNADDMKNPRTGRIG
jgi:hypothetical protein